MRFLLSYFLSYVTETRNLGQQGQYMWSTGSRNISVYIQNVEDGVNISLTVTNVNDDSYFTSLVIDTSEPSIVLSGVHASFITDALIIESIVSTPNCDSKSGVYEWRSEDFDIVPTTTDLYIEPSDRKLGSVTLTKMIFSCLKE